MTGHTTEMPDLGLVQERKRHVHLLSRLTSPLKTLPAWVTLSIGLTLSVCIGWLDWATGSEVSLFVFYSMPVMLVVWFVNLRAGFILSVINGIIWMLANLHTNHFDTLWGYHLANINRIVCFAMMALGAHAARKKYDADSEHIRMLEEIRQMEGEILSVSEHEQQRIGQDLHDGICQQLAAIGCAARALADDLQTRDVPEAHDAIKIEEAIQQSVIDARNLARGIFPVHVDRTGLCAALTDLANATWKLTGVPITVLDSMEVQVDDPDVAMHLYRISQEAVANAVKHSGATSITLALDARDQQLELRIEDNGKGMPANFARGVSGMGLRTMRYRAHAMGANLSIEPRSGGGTLVRCVLRVRTHNPRHDSFHT